MAALTKRRELFAFKALDSRIQSANVKSSEKWLGYFVGPMIISMCYFVTASTYLNVFYTDVLKVGAIWSGAFLTVMPIVSKIIDAITNLIMGYVIDRTKSRQGKARPWILISAPVLLVAGILLYAVPQASQTVQVVWITVSYNLFYAVAYTMYNMSHGLMVPLSTRNSRQRDGLAIFVSVGISMVPGAIVALVIPTLVLPYIGVDQSKWMLVMSILAILALPAVMLEYYFTRERVTEETQGESEAILTVSTKEQLKGCLKSKYWVAIMLVNVAYQLYNNFQATSIIYFANWVLGTYNDGSTLALLNVGGQFPLGIGILALWPLVRRFGKRNVMVFGFGIGILGCILGMTNVHSMPVVLTGLILKSIGTIPITYILVGMLADALDHVEYVNGFRCDGFSTSVQSVILTIMSGISAGLFNLGLSVTHYIAPEGTAEQIAAMTQSSAAQTFFSWGIFLFPAIGFAAIILILLPYKLDKELPSMQHAIVERHKAETEARGEIYVSPEEKARLEQEELDRVAEEKRIAELKALCAKKGLSFEEEEANYQVKLAEKKAKAEAKAAKRAKK